MAVHQPLAVEVPFRVLAHIAAVEAELFALNLTKPMSLPQKWAFCESAHRRLVFQSKTDRLRLIIEWADSWQALWLGSKPNS